MMNAPPRHHRPGLSLLEVILFIGIMAIIMGTVTSVYIATEESRIRQQRAAEVEQRGTQLLETFTKTIRRAEAILVPAVNQTGSILALQMALNAEYPTILASTATGNILSIQKTALYSLLNSRVTVKNLVFRNVNNNNVIFSFDLQSPIPIVHPMIYTRHFDGTVTLFPDDQLSSGGCTACPLPSCVSHQYKWYQCETDICTLSTSTFAC